MLTINLQNIEDLIFLDKKLQSQLPEFRHMFEQWKLAQYTSALRPMGKRAMLDLLNSLDNQNALLSRYFGTSVTIDKLDYHLVKNCDFPLEEIETEIDKLEGYANFSIYRDKDHIYISFWR